MEVKDAIDLLEHYNKWRKGADVPMVQPKALSEAIDLIVELYRKKF